MDFLFSMTNMVTSKAPLNRDDMREFLKFGMMGFLVLGGLKASQSYARRTTLSTSVLKYTTECFHLDPMLITIFATLQKYDRINAWALRMAVTNIDCILYLKQALTTRVIAPCNSDKVMCFTYFTVACKRLDQFKDAVTKSMSPQHSLIVSTATRDAKDRLKIHVAEVLRLCSDFNPGHLLARVDADVSEALQSQT